MTQCNVKDLTGAALDYAAAKCEGNDPVVIKGSVFECDHKGRNRRPNYSTNWAHGGPIIERERIDLQAMIKSGSDYDEWRAFSGAGSREKRCYGKTPLIAAVRCFVLSKVGETIEIPSELI